MDFLQKRIREKLIQRGNSERQRAEEWERSLKPTTYLGKNLYQELGGTPIEGRYLGQVGMIPGQSVPNIGRNPNKPVIPGLPIEPTQAPEEGGLIRQTGNAYSAIFTREIPGGRTIFTELEMLQRDPGAFNATDWSWRIDVDIPGRILHHLNDRDFYYWNNSTLQHLFTFQSSSLIASGTLTYDTIGAPGLSIDYNLTTFDKPGNLENRMPNLNAPINTYSEGEYLLICKDTVNTGIGNGFLYTQGTTGDLSALFQFTIGSNNYSAAVFQYSQSQIDSGDPVWTIGVRVATGISGSANWELYRVYGNSSYFTTTENGTSFVHITNGNVGDSLTKIRYFTGTGETPARLSLLSQSDVDAGNFPSFDWRKIWLEQSTIDDNFPLKSYVGCNAYYWAYQYGKVTSTVWEGFSVFWIYTFSGNIFFTFLDYIFQGNGTPFVAQGQAYPEFISGFNPVTGELIESFGSPFDLEAPRIDLSSFGTEGVDWYIEDICVPNYRNDNNLGLYFEYWYPMIAYYPFTRTIFF